MGFTFPDPELGGCLIKQGKGAPTPILARIPLAQTRHSGCWGVRWGRISSFLYGGQVQMLADPNAEAWLNGPLTSELPGAPPGSQSPSPRLCPRAAPRLEKMSQP